MVSELEIPVSDLRREVRSKKTSWVIACGQLKLLREERYKEQVCAQRRRLEKAVLLDMGESSKVLRRPSYQWHQVLRVVKKKKKNEDVWVSQ